MVSFAHYETARALWLAVLAESSNGLAKMVLADRCDERALREPIGYALRWAGTRGHHPIIHPPAGRDRRPWVYWRSALTGLATGLETLPTVVCGPPAAGLTAPAGMASRCNVRVTAQLGRAGGRV